MASATSFEVKASENLLLELFKQHVAKNLKAEALASIDTALDAAVAQAVKDMEPAILMQMDIANDRLLTMLITHEKRPAKS